MSENPFQSPLAEDEPQDETPVDMVSGRLAGRWVRLAAQIVDGLILTLVMLPVQYYFKYGVFVENQLDTEEISFLNPFSMYAQMSTLHIVLTIVVPAVAYLLLNGYLLNDNGQTLGKRLLRIKIVRKNGARADFTRLIIHRYFALWIIYFIPVLGMLFSLIDPLMIFRKSRYCLHDDIADTVVVVA